MANTIDLLGSGGLTAQRNSSISKPYILYQVISMGASILGPASICLMIAGEELSQKKNCKCALNFIEEKPTANIVASLLYVIIIFL